MLCGLAGIYDLMLDGRGRSIYERLSDWQKNTEYAVCHSGRRICSSIDKIGSECDEHAVGGDDIGAAGSAVEVEQARSKFGALAIWRYRDDRL